MGEFIEDENGVGGFLYPTDDAGVGIVTVIEIKLERIKQSGLGIFFLAWGEVGLVVAEIASGPGVE